MITKYIAIGAFNTVFGLTAFTILSIYIPQYISYLCSEVIAHTLRYNLLNQWWAKGRRKKDSKYKKIRNYTLTTLLVMVLNTTVAYIMGESMKLPSIVTGVTTVVLTMAVGYISSKRIFLER